MHEFARLCTFSKYHSNRVIISNNFEQKKHKMKRNDLLTGEVFIPARITQKFSSPSNRIKFHNNQASNLRKSLMFVNGPLKTNYSILNNLMIGKNSAVFHKEFLRGKGYVFEVLTHYKNVDGIRLPCVYFFAINALKNGDIEVLRLNTTSND
jgi:hypothetical protein